MASSKKSTPDNPVVEDVFPASNQPVGFVSTDVIVPGESEVVPSAEGTVVPDVLPEPAELEPPVRLTPEEVAEANVEEIIDEAPEIVLDDTPTPEPVEPIDVEEANDQEIADETHA